RRRHCSSTARRTRGSRSKRPSRCIRRSESCACRPVWCAIPTPTTVDGLRGTRCTGITRSSGGSSVGSTPRIRLLETALPSHGVARLLLRFGRGPSDSGDGSASRAQHMAELILEYSTAIRTETGDRFVARAYGEERPDRTWIGWIEFVPVAGSTPALRTDRET